MRRLWVLLALLLAPLGSTQDATPVHLLDDGSGDVDVVAADQRQDAPQEAAAATDLVALDVQERADVFTFTLTLHALESATAQEIQVIHLTDFTHHDQAYRVATGWFDVAGVEQGAFAWLMQQDPGDGSYYYVMQLEPVADVGAATITVDVPRGRLLDTQGAAPYPGRELTGFATESYTLTRLGFSVMGQPAPTIHLADRMPDSGVGGPLPVTLGLAQTGHARLASEEPFRASNGEATTFVFKVQARNIGDADDSFSLSTGPLPTGWIVRMPDTRLDLEAGEEVEVPVVLQTPFAHAHGSTARFVLEMQSESDAGSTGRIELGVYYPAIPQPAGHHDTVYFHSTDYSDEPLSMAFGTIFGTLFGYEALQEAYMNAAEQDENDDAVPVEGSQCGTSIGATGVDSHYCWWVPLQPALQMGLDVEGDREGSITVPVRALAPLPAARLEGSIFYWQPIEEDGDFFRREGIEIFTIASDAPVEIGANSEGVLQATVTPVEGIDVIPYTRGAGLELRLELITARPDNVLFGPSLLPELMPGGSMQLPLRDYSDPVDEVFASDKLHIAPVGPTERLVNPGKTIVFKASLHNAGDLEDTYRIGIVGTHPDWARTVGATTVTLASDEAKEIAVAVTVPGGAADGERADLIIEVSSMHDINTRGLVRVVAEVDTDAEHADEAAQAAAEDKGAPALPLLLLAAALIVAAARRR